MYSQDWSYASLPKLHYLSKCYLKITAPALQGGVWIIRNLKRVVMVRIVINSAAPGNNDMLKDIVIDDKCRDIAMNFCTSHYNLITVGAPKYTSRNISYWMPLFPLKEELEDLIEHIYQIRDDPELEIKVGFKITLDLNDICMLDEGSEEITAIYPMVVQFKVLGVDEKIKKTFTIGIGR
jgi:hypothetical protein